MSRNAKPKPSTGSSQRVTAATSAPATAEMTSAVPAPGEPNPATPQGPDTTGAASAPASAAAEAAPAPVDPHPPTDPGASPEPANDPNGNPPTGGTPEPAVPLTFVGPEEKGVEITIVSAVIIDNVEVRSGSVIVPFETATDLVKAGAAAFAED